MLSSEAPIKRPAVPPIETKHKLIEFSLLLSDLPTKSSVVLTTVRLKRDVGSASILINISLCEVFTLIKANPTVYL